MKITPGPHFGQRGMRFFGVDFDRLYNDNGVVHITEIGQEKIKTEKWPRPTCRLEKMSMISLGKTPLRHSVTLVCWTSGFSTSLDSNTCALNSLNIIWLHHDVAWVVAPPQSMLTGPVDKIWGRKNAEPWCTPWQILINTWFQYAVLQCTHVNISDHDW